MGSLSLRLAEAPLKDIQLAVGQLLGAAAMVCGDYVKNLGLFGGDAMGGGEMVTVDDHLSISSWEDKSNRSGKSSCASLRAFGLFFRFSGRMIELWRH